MNRYLYSLTCSVVLLLCVWAAALMAFEMPVYADCPSNNTADSLITAAGTVGGLGNMIGNDVNKSPVCIYGAPAYIPTGQAKIRVDSYDDLYARYYSQGKANKQVLTINTPSSNTLDLGTSPLAINTVGGTLYYVNGNLIVRPGSITGTKVGIIFVSGNLYIPGNLIYGENNSMAGLVFVVKGQINIGTDVSGAASQTIDAVLMSQGTTHSICSACDENGIPIGANKALGQYNPNLFVNGGMISLSTADNALMLVRVPADTRYPAETIKADPKYLVILKDTMSSAIKIWSEQ